MLERKYREIFDTIIPQSELAKVIAANGMQLRERSLDVQKLITALIASSAAGDGGRQAKAIKMYTDHAEKKVTRSASYAWFDDRLSGALSDLAQKALTFAASHEVDLPPWILRDVSDWHIFDSTTVKVDIQHFDTYPGVGDYAAVKVHKRMSLGIGTTVAYHLSPAREHDSQHLHIDESMRGLGILVDLGYASFDTISKCEEHGVKFVMRLKDNWKPTITAINRGSINKPLKAKADFDIVAKHNLALDGTSVDLSAVIKKGDAHVNVRIAGVCAPDGKYRFYLTNLPKKTGPQQVSDLYRARWEIEINNKLDKSCFSLDSIGAKTTGALHTMIHAAMLGSTIACLIAHVHMISQKPEETGPQTVLRDYPPLHPALVASYMSTACARIADTMLLDGAAADKAWAHITSMIHHFGAHTNWRTKPSILDQMRGWPLPKNARKTARKSSKTP